MYVSCLVKRQTCLSFDLFFFFTYFITFKNCSYSVITYLGPLSTFSRTEGNHPCLEYRCQKALSSLSVILGGLHWVGFPNKPEEHSRTGEDLENNSRTKEIRLLDFHFYLFLVGLGLRCCGQAFSSCSEWGRSWSQCDGRSLRWLFLLQNTGTRRTGFGSCSTWAQ